MHPERGRAGEQVGGLRATGEHDRDDAAEAGVADLARPPGGRRAAGPARRRCPGRARRAGAGCAARAGPATPRSVPGIAPSRSRRPLSTSYSWSSVVTRAPRTASLWPGEVLGRRVHDDVGAEGRAALAQGSGEGVVDDDVRAGLVGGGGDRRDVGDLERRVGRRLEPDQGGVVARRRRPPRCR